MLTCPESALSNQPNGADWRELRYRKGIWSTKIDVENKWIVLKVYCSYSLTIIAKIMIMIAVINPRDCIHAEYTIVQAKPKTDVLSPYVQSGIQTFRMLSSL